jgi:hypothetical protein
MKLLRKSAKNLGRRRRQPTASPGSYQKPDQDTAATSFGYRRARPTDEASQKPPKKRQLSVPSIGRFLWLHRLAHLILLVAIVSSAVNILTLSSSPKILPLSSGDSATFLHDQSAYQQAAEQLLARSFWNRNKITINTTQISEQLVAQFPELSSANVTLPLLAHRPIVYVEASQPALILATNGGSFVLDSRGKALLLSSQLPTGKHLDIPLVSDQSGVTVKLNHQALSSGYVSFIQTVTAQLDAKHLSISSMTLPPEANELDVWLTGQPYYIKFNLQQQDHARQQVGTFLAVLSQLQGQGITPAQYIDVRVDGRAYYQ